MPRYHELPSGSVFHEDLKKEEADTAFLPAAVYRPSGAAATATTPPPAATTTVPPPSAFEVSYASKRELKGMICGLLDFIKKGPTVYADARSAYHLARLWIYLGIWLRAGWKGGTTIDEVRQTVEATLCPALGVAYASNRREIWKRISEVFGMKLHASAIGSDEPETVTTRHKGDVVVPACERLTDKRVGRLDCLWPYKLNFRDGRALMLNWCIFPERFPREACPPPGRLEFVPANSQYASATCGLSPMPAGFAGYVLGMGYAMYMGRHRAKADREKLDSPEFDPTKLIPGFTHGSYKPGRSILCAGEIAIADGRVIMVSNSSGHFRPEAIRMRDVADYLIMNGIRLTEVVFKIRDAIIIDPKLKKDEKVDLYPERYYNALEWYRLQSAATPLTPSEVRTTHQKIPGYIAAARDQAVAWGNVDYATATDQQILQILFPA